MTTKKKTASKTAKKATAETKEAAAGIAARLRNRAIEMQQRSLELQESAFDRTYDAVNSLQERGEDRMAGWLDSSDRVPSEAKSLVKEWIGFNQTARENYRAAVNSSFTLGQRWFEGLKKSA